MSREHYAEREVPLNQNGIRALQPEYQPLETLMADAIRRVRRSAVSLTPRESQLLSDVSRPDARGTRMIREAADIARHRCRNPEDSAAIGDAIARYALAGHPGLFLPFLDTLRREGATNQMADEAIWEHILSPSAASRERVIECHRAQELASRAVVNLMLSERR